MIEEIKYEDKLLAIILSNRFTKEGVHFITPGDLSQQLAYMRHPKGKKINPHIHNLVPRNIIYTQEVLVLKKGKLKVDFFNDRNEYVDSRVLCAGDTILLVSGGHGFEVIEEVEVIEVKQGPYLGDDDKVHFDPE